VRSKDFKKWVQDAMALVAREHAKRKSANDEVARMEKAVHAAKSPARAREVLAGVIEPAVLTPGPDGYEVALTLKNETAALAGGRSLSPYPQCGQTGVVVVVSSWLSGFIDPPSRRGSTGSDVIER
jgi:hypothetical protein